MRETYEVLGELGSRMIRCSSSRWRSRKSRWRTSTSSRAAGPER
jgi:hypothetical protein